MNVHQDTANFTPGFIPNWTPQQRAFRRRQNHAAIEAMTGRILQRLGYPSRRLRDLIAAIQSAHGAGRDAETPGAPFRRSYLTLAEFLEMRGEEDGRIQRVSRLVKAHLDWQRRAGWQLIEIEPSQINGQSTKFVDHLTPVADEAHQRALSSPLWKTDKRAATAEAVNWALTQLPFTDPDLDGDEVPERMPVSEYEALHGYSRDTRNFRT